ncbi:MAG: Trm112 family protein [Desulfurococcaceae archaeon]
MRYWGLDVLRCVHCKHFPLEMHVIEEEKQEVDTSGIEKPLCKSYCGYLKTSIEQGREYPCDECLKVGIKTAVLYCTNCKHWYPVRNGIVVMLTDSKRKREKDLEFLRTYRDKIPEHILREGKPVNLAGEAGPAPT